VELITEGFEETWLADDEKLVIQLTDVVLGAETLAHPLRAELLEHFDEGQLVELCVGVALFLGFSKIAIALGQAPADMPTMVVPTPDWPG
jgi:alkylhydroperoxidase family enzyme